jgi:DNA-binding NarL/FixJ family response regulator
MKLHPGSKVNCCHDLEIASPESGIFIIDDNELSHEKVLRFLNRADHHKTLVLINELRVSNIVQIANLGIKNIVSYYSIAKDFSSCMNNIMKGESFFSEDIKSLLLDSLGKNSLASPVLTKKEVEITALLGQGFSATEVGSALNISNLTVNVHRSNIKRKLNIFNNSHFIKYCSDSLIK